MVDQGILNSNVSIEEEIYNFEKGLKDDGNDWTGIPTNRLKRRFSMYLHLRYFRD